MIMATQHSNGLGLIPTGVYAERLHPVRSPGFSGCADCSRPMLGYTTVDDSPLQGTTTNVLWGVALGLLLGAGAGVIYWKRRA